MGLPWLGGQETKSGATTFVAAPPEWSGLRLTVIELLRRFFKRFLRARKYFYRGLLGKSRVLTGLWQ
jgi:hypothetical protein